ncbi:MAG: ATP-binding protein [Chlorobi bacterium]|nr:ATP-binding protein [Chlorobiota bacterium]
MSSFLRTFSLKISISFENISEVAHKILDFLDQNNFDEEFKMRMEICIVEALNNIVKHAYANRDAADRPVEIKAEISGSFLTIEMIDSGISRTVFEKAQLKFNPNDIQSLPEGGMGLFLIEKIMDDTEYFSKDGKNFYLMKKRISKRTG